MIEVFNKTDLKNRKNWIAVTVYILLLNLFLFHPIGSFALFLILSITFIFILTVSWKRNLVRTHLPTAAGITFIYVCNLWAILTRANSAVQALTVFSSIALLTYLLYLLNSTHSFFNNLYEVIVAPFLVVGDYLKALIELPGTLIKDSSISISSRNKKRLSTITTGILLSIPILFILNALFSSADPIFAKISQDIMKSLFFDIELSSRFKNRLLFSMFIFVFSASLSLYKNRQSLSPEPPKSKLFNMPREVSIVLTSAALIFTLFLAIQWSYIFVSVERETNLSQFGVATYSEYVQQGFSELLKSALIIFSLIWLGTLTIKHSRNSENTYLNTIQLILVSEFVLFILSIYRRISLYQIYHGWSMSRIYGSIFLFWLLGMLVTVTGRLLSNYKWVKAEVFITVALLLVVSLFNSEKYITLNNPPTVNNRIDYLYLAKMTPDGYLGWLKSYENVRQTLLKSEFNDKTQFSEEERRQIAYSGMILAELTSNYLDLTAEYAQETRELKDYEQILLYHKKAETDYLNRIGNTGSNEPNKPLSRTKNDVMRKLQIIDRLLLRLELGSIESEEIRFHVFRISKFPESIFFFNNSQVAYSFFNIYSYEIDQDFDKATIWNKALAWNFAEEEAYLSIKNKISMANLLDLQKQYFILYDRIVQQPGDHSYPQDTLPTSVFLRN